MKEKGIERHFIEEIKSEKAITVKDEDPISFIDTFQLKFPKETEFLEMQFCIDSF